MQRRFRTTLGALVALALLVALVPATALAVSPLAIAYPPDAYEPDDTPAQAMVYDADMEVTQHTLSDADDEDWTLFSAETTGQPFLIETEPTAGRDIDLEMEIFATDANGAPVDLPNMDGINYSDDALWNTYGSQCYFEAPAPGDYLVKVNPLDGVNEIGAYTLTLSDGIARRIYGSDRFDTAAKVSRTIWPMTDLWGQYQDPVGGTEPEDPAFIVVANGLNWPDALAGSALAAGNDGVLLLTRPEEMPEVTKAELQRLLTMAYGYDPASSSYYGMRVYILGGTNAVSQAVEDEIGYMDGVGEVIRLEGATRYETAAEIGNAFVDEYSGVDAVFVTGGASPWDALAASPVAGWSSAPVLLSGKSDVPTATMDFIADNSIQTVVVVGGEAVVDSTAYAELEAAVANIERVSGDTRYATALAVAQWGVDDGMDPGGITLVSGTSFADGLAAAPISYYTEGPMLLTRPELLVDEVYDFFDANAMPDMGSYVVGGPAAVHDDVYWEFKAGMVPYLVSLP